MESMADLQDQYMQIAGSVYPLRFGTATPATIMQIKISQLN